MAWSDRDTTLYDELPVKLADAYDSAGKRLTAVDLLINETIGGSAGLSMKAARADAARIVAWEAVARDLARQVINAEAEITELDDAEDHKTDLADVAKERDRWMTWYWEIAAKRDTLAIRRQEEEQAHCDTYVEAVRLAKELKHTASDREYWCDKAITRQTP